MQKISDAHLRKVMLTPSNRIANRWDGKSQGKLECGFRSLQQISKKIYAYAYKHMGGGAGTARVLENRLIFVAGHPGRSPYACTYMYLSC